MAGLAPVSTSSALAAARTQAAAPPALESEDSTELRRTFDAFVGETFFSQMLAAMRKTVDKPAYFHGGRGEEVFQGQLDQLLAQRLAASTASQFSGPMFELFNLNRQ